MNRVAVVIPTWRRPEMLRSAVRSIVQQSFEVASIFPVVRDTDRDTWLALTSIASDPALDRTEFKPLTVRLAGFLPPLTVAQHHLRSRTEEIVVVIDDDCEADVDFVAKLVSCYEESTVVAAGGRCIGYYRGEPLLEKPAKVVGRIDWFGRAYSGMTSPPESPGRRCVEFMMGGAASYRRDIFCELLLPEELNRDVAHGYEVFVGAQLRRRGSICYEPDATVSHFTGHRELVGLRPVDSSNVEAVAAGRLARMYAAENSAFVIWYATNGVRRLSAVTMQLLLGSSEYPGILYRVFKPWRRTGISVRTALAARLRGLWRAVGGRWKALAYGDVC